MNPFYQFAEQVISSVAFVSTDQLRPHEQVVAHRRDALHDYLVSLQPNILVPSVIACDQSGTIIDGHHRYHALMALGVTSIPVTFIRYDSPLIVPDLVGQLTKEMVLAAAETNRLLPPKSSYHHIRTGDAIHLPLIVVSATVAVPGAG